MSYLDLWSDHDSVLSCYKDEDSPALALLKQSVMTVIKREHSN